MILADTSLWVEQLRWPDGPLTTLLQEGAIAMHPFVIGELACGNLRNRRSLLEMLSDLPSLQPATEFEAMSMIERHALAGVGLGYIDVHLMASAAIAGVRVWTTDKAMAAASTRIGIVYQPAQ
jgi:predicted nucleic acid-binding protein